MKYYPKYRGCLQSQAVLLKWLYIFVKNLERRKFEKLVNIIEICVKMKLDIKTLLSQFQGHLRNSDDSSFGSMVQFVGIKVICISFSDGSSATVGRISVCARLCRFCAPHSILIDITFVFAHTVMLFVFFCYFSEQYKHKHMYP